jgi:diadenosine tetraphosphate (Ap4A) HIT family hydrolase
MYDKFPVTEGHTLIIPKHHVESLFMLSENDAVSLTRMIREVKDIIDKKYKPKGYNIGINEGRAAGRTIDHLHIHLIPRYEGDMEDPTGGVRHVIPEKGNYKKNS